METYIVETYIVETNIVETYIVETYIVETYIEEFCDGSSLLSHMCLERILTCGSIIKPHNCALLCMPYCGIHGIELHKCFT